MSRVGLAAAALALALAGAGPRAARAGAPELAVERLLESVGSPAGADAVLALLRKAPVADPAVASRVVARLRFAGGAAAADALMTFVAHRDATVRAEALTAAAALGLRTDAVAAVRARLYDPDAGVRLAACAALGRLGAADDVDRLLGFVLLEPEKPLRQAAFRALVALTGVRLPYDRDAWAWWWRTTRPLLAAHVARALDAVERGSADDAALARAHASLERDGWVLLSDVADAARYWLRLGDPRLRAEGYRLATSLRLGSLALDVRDALHFETHPDGVEPGHGAAKALGLREEDWLPDPDR